jgi:hypothetical protein
MRKLTLNDYEAKIARLESRITDLEGENKVIHNSLRLHCWKISRI